MASPSNNNDYIMPRVSPMTEILVSRNPDMSDASPGFVVSVGISSITAVAFNKIGMLTFDCCWHRNDPRVINKPHLLRDDSSKGVFDIAPHEKEFREMKGMVESLLQRIAKQDGVISELAAKVTKAK